ncbi:MAG TPA: HupE/UreJ family protein [Casimicrobiaceae bacterium]|nr:HupE/UreJ family protein [Casimicrobiaceae bacterium]
MLVAFAVNLPLTASLAMTRAFALLHGYAHGARAPVAPSRIGAHALISPARARAVRGSVNESQGYATPATGRRCDGQCRAETCRLSD